MAKLRICLRCHQAGITAEFPNGNKLRQHMRSRHPKPPEQQKGTATNMRAYRRKVLLSRTRWGMG